MSRVRPGIPDNRGVTFRSPRLPLLLAASALLLTGCATTPTVDRPADAQASRPPVAEPAGPTAPPVTPVPPAPQAPVPEPEPTRPALEDLVLTSEGLGTIRFGDDPEDYDPETSLLVPERDACGDGFTIWASAYGGHEFAIAQLREPAGAVGLIGVRDDRIPTDRGLRSGMTLDEALVLYPEATLRAESIGIDLYAVDSTPGDIFFTVAGGPSGTEVLTSLNAALEAPDYINPHGYTPNCL